MNGYLWDGAAVRMRQALSGLRALILLTLLGGCAGNGSVPQAAAPALALGWPPQGLPTRDVSALHQVTIPATETAAVGGEYVYLDDSLLLLAAPKLTWAIYSVRGYNSAIRPQSVAFERSADTDSQSKLYIGLANFARQRWDFPADPLADSADFSPSADYVGPSGQIYIAAIQWTVHDLRLVSLTITNDSDAPLPPEGLSAAVTAEGIQLDWLASAGASGYDLLHSTMPDNIGAAIIAPNISSLAYLDTEALVGKINYYSVRAIGPGGTSWPCTPVGVFMPETDLPAPTNLRTESHTDLEATLAWDWSQGPPSYFRVYVKEEPDFNLDPPFHEDRLVPGAELSCTIDIVPGHNYWFRVAAVKNFKRGQMSDAVQIETNAEWHWAPTEIIGPGHAMVRTAVVEGDLAAAYFDGFDVKLATRDGGDWTIHDTPLTDELDVCSDTDNDGGFYGYLDVCWTGSQYFIVSHATRPDALWYCLGNPGSWKVGRIAGGSVVNETGFGEGRYCECDYSNGELGVIYSKVTSAGIGFQDDDGMFSSSLDFGDTWTSTKFLTNVAVCHHSLHAEDGNWYVLAVKQFPIYPDPLPQEFWFMQRSEGFAPHILYSEIGEHFGLWPDLERFGDHWLTCAFDNNDTSLYAMEGDGDSWETKPVDGYPGAYVGAYCRIATHGDEAVMVYNDYHDAWWQIARYKDGVWAPYAVLLPSDQMESPDVQYLDDDPYVVLHDTTDNMIKCARAVPPIT